MLIDIHAHFGQRSADAVPAPRLATYAGVSGVDFLLVSNRDAATEPAGAANLDETDANVACLEACQRQPRLIPLYWVRPGRADSSVYAFTGALASEPFAAALFAPAAGGFDAGDEVLDDYLSVLASIGRPAVFCVSDDERAAPGKVYEAARRHAALSVVLCPCGAGEARRRECVEVVRRAQQRGDAGVYVDTSHAGAAEVRAAVEAVGAERVLYGTNALAFGDSHVPRHIALLDELRGLLPGGQFQQVTAGNAMQLFRLGKRASGAAR